MSEDAVDPPSGAGAGDPGIRSVADIIRRNAALAGDRAALWFEEQSWTYAELDAESNQVAQALLAAGVRPQDRVAYIGKNTPQFFTFLFGAAKVSAVSVAVNWRLAPREMEYILDNAGAKVVLVGEDYVDHVDEMSLDAVSTVVVIEAGSAGSTPQLPHPTYHQWLAGRRPVDPAVEVGWDDTCFQLYTSGTTGLPKGVELTNQNLLQLLDIAGEEWRLRVENDAPAVNLVAMPVFHIAGSGWGVVGLYNGATNVLLRDVDPGLILELIPRLGITNMLLVPAVLGFVLATPGAGQTDFSSLRSVVYGASPIAEDVLVRSMELMGCDFVQAYGLTETTGAITILRPADHDPGGPQAKLLRSAGQPWGDVELRIVDPATGEDQPDGEVGEVWCRSQQNLKRYWASPEATDAIFPEGRDEHGLGWLRTGDAGYLNDGYLFIHDRVKDMIISGGENIFPAEVENVLMGHPSVADVAVIGVPDPTWGETVKAIVTAAPGAEPDGPALIEHCREHLAHYKCPTSVDWLDTIPRNPSGKILKTELRQPYWEGHDRLVG